LEAHVLNLLAGVMGYRSDNCGGGSDEVAVLLARRLFARQGILQISHARHFGNFVRGKFDTEFLFEANDELDLGQAIPFAHVFRGHLIPYFHLIVVKDFPKDGTNTIIH
jgi:hypothetical protein